MPKNYCIMQIWAESGKSTLPICNYSQILYQFLTFTQNLKRSRDKIDSFDYTLSVSEEKEYSPVYSDLSVDYNTTDSGIVASVTNNATSAVDYVLMDVVYLKDGKMVNFSELSFMDDNQELQPGTTLSQEGTCYSDSGFDDVVIAINGRK